VLIIIIKALKLEAQEAVCYAKLMMMIIYLAYNMNVSEKILVGSRCFSIGATSIERAKTTSIFYFKYAGAE